MQRRAAAIYFAFFVVVGGAAFGLLSTTSAPHVSFDAETYAPGDDVTLNERTYTVADITEEGGEGGGHGGGEATMSGELTWLNESAVLDATLDHNSTIPSTDVSWEGQQARQEATFEDGDTVEIDGSEYAVSINDSAGTLTLTNVEDEADNETYEQGGEVPYRGYDATVTEVASGSATLVWGDEYLVEVENATQPEEFTFVQQRDVEQRAQADPALYDEPVVQDDELKVTFRANDSNVPAEEYFGPIETYTVAEGETLVYQGNETTVDAVDNETIRLVWDGERTESVELEEGGNFTANGQDYFAHFPDNSSVQLLSNDEYYDSYAAQNERIESYNERQAGLWGVFDLSVIAAIILLATAYLPVKG